MLKKQHSPVLGTPSEKGDKKSLEDMRTQLEVLRQQVRTAGSKPGWVLYSTISPSPLRTVPARIPVLSFSKKNQFSHSP